MDTLLEERWKAATSPFDGDCLHLVDYVELPRLRKLMSTVVDVLQSDYIATSLFRVEDWHEHDGYVTQRSNCNWDDIRAILATDDSLYSARHGDTYVSWAYYPEDFSFLFRFSVFDKDEDQAHPGISGECNLCAPKGIIDRVLVSTTEALDLSNLSTINAKRYFDSRYAG